MYCKHGIRYICISVKDSICSHFVCNLHAEYIRNQIHPCLPKQDIGSMAELLGVGARNKNNGQSKPSGKGLDRISVIPLTLKLMINHHPNCNVTKLHLQFFFSLSLSLSREYVAPLPFEVPGLFISSRQAI